MARYRSRSRSFSPRRPRSRTPPRLRKRYDDDASDDEPPRGRYRDSRSRRDRRGSPLPSGLLVRNLPLDARAEDLRVPFEKYGPVKDVYLPKNYYTGEPRGFGFVKYRYGEDAAKAKERMNHKVIGGREIQIVFAEENRKTPQEMSSTGRSSRHESGSRRRSPPRSPRRRFRSSSRSASPPRSDTRDQRVKDDHRSSRRSRSLSRSYSPQEEREHRSSRRSPSPVGNGRSPQEVRVHPSARSISPRDNRHSPSLSGSRSCD